MPLDTLHPAYIANLKHWKKMRDVLAGEEQIKNQGHQYLPPLGGMDQTGYDAYKARASFFNATGRTAEGIPGMLTHKAPTFTHPESLKEAFDTIGLNNESLYVFVDAVIKELVDVGRCGVLIDLPAGPAPRVDDAGEPIEAAPEPTTNKAAPYVALYKTETITNWQKETRGGRTYYTSIVLHEVVEVPDPTDETGLRTVAQEQWRWLRLDLSKPEPVYSIEVWHKEKDINSDSKEEQVRWVRDSQVIPKRQGGKPFRYIPFIFINDDGVSDEIELPPLLPLANVNLSHYRNSADLEHGLHFTALPTAWVAGFKKEDTNGLHIGSATAWVTENAQATAGYLEFTGSGLNAIVSNMGVKEKQMAILGARLLEAQKVAAEAAETVKIRQTSERNVLVRMAGAVGEGISQAMRWVAWIMGQTELEDPQLPNADIAAVLDTNYEHVGMDPGIMAGLISAVQSGDMSWPMFFYNMKKAQLYPDEHTEQDERDLITSGRPGGTAPGTLIDKDGKPIGQPKPPEVDEDGNPIPPELDADGNPIPAQDPPPAGEDDEEDGEGEGEEDDSETVDLERVKAEVEMYGVMVRAGAITPQLEDEVYFRERFKLPQATEGTKAAWAAGQRRPITIAAPAEPEPTPDPAKPVKPTVTVNDSNKE